MDELLDKLIDISKRLRKALVRGDPAEIMYLLHIEHNLATRLKGMDDGSPLPAPIVEKIQAFRVFNKGNGLMAQGYLDKYKSQMTAASVYDSSGRLAC